MDDRRSLTRFAWLSIAAAVATIGLKAAAYALTGSVGLLSDALESVVNLVGALMALAMLRAAALPPDAEHAYGHTKAEYFSSVLEGSLICVAALSIAVAAVDRLRHPRAIEQVGIGLAVSAAAALINLGAAGILLKAGRRHHSITLEANARHLMTDVWTSAGVVAGVAAVAVTGWQRLDPIIALVVAVNIVWSGYGLVTRSIAGLMDTALPQGELDAVLQVLDSHARDGIRHHALRTRQSGARRFMSVHVLVPGAWTVQRGHDLLERIESDLRAVVPNLTVLTHLEPVEDPVSGSDQELDRRRPG